MYRWLPNDAGYPPDEPWAGGARFDDGAIKNVGAQPQAVVGRDDQLASFDLLLARSEQRRSEQSMIISGRGALFELSPKVRWSDRFKQAAAVLKAFTLTMDAAGSWSIGLDAAAAEGYADTANLSLDLTDVFVALSEGRRSAAAG